MTKDVAGKIVKEGDRVRVLSIDSSLIDSLEPEEKPRVRSMIGEVLVVDEITESGHALVEKWWQVGPDTSIVHYVSLCQKEFELVENAA